jgi:hypothetical protein
MMPAKNGGENQKVFATVPSGSILLNDVEPSVASQFKVGSEYFFDITPVEG